MGLYDNDTHRALYLSESAGNDSSGPIKPCFECSKRLDDIEPVLDDNGFINPGYIELEFPEGFMNICPECNEKCINELLNMRNS